MKEEKIIVIEGKEIQHMNNRLKKKKKKKKTHIRGCCRTSYYNDLILKCSDSTHFVGNLVLIYKNYVCTQVIAPILSFIKTLKIINK